MNRQNKNQRFEKNNAEPLAAFPDADTSVYPRRDEPTTLPSFPDVEGGSPAYPGDDEPTILPSFPDVEGGSPAYPGNRPPLVPPVYPIIKPGLPPAQRCCRVRFFHAAPQCGPVNIEVGAQRVVSNLAFGNFSSYNCYGEGFRPISIINARNRRSVLLRKTVPFNSNDTITYAIVNNPVDGSLELVQISDNFCGSQMGGFSCLRMVNLLLGSSSLDLLLRDGRVLFSDVRYKESTISRRLRSGNYTFYVSNTPSQIQPRFVDVEMDDRSVDVSDRYLPGYGELDPVLSFSLRVRSGLAYTVYLIGQENTDEVQAVISAF